MALSDEKTLEFPTLSLTNSYQYTGAMDVSDANQIMVDISWAKGSSTSLEVIVQYSNDNSTFYTYQRCVDGSPVSCDDRVYQWTVTGNKSVAFPVAHKYIRLGAKITGTTGNSTFSARCMASVV